MAVKTGEKAPDFSLYDTDKKLRSLSEFAGKNLVLIFYPGAFTGVCTKEMCTLRDSLASFNNLNAQVVGISVDSPFANKGFATQNQLAYPLLSDFTKEVSQKYCGLYDSFAGLPGYTAAKRSAFVLDAKGVVRYSWISENPGVEPNYDEIKNALSSL